MVDEYRANGKWLWDHLTRLAQVADKHQVNATTTANG